MARLLIALAVLVLIAVPVALVLALRHDEAGAAAVPDRLGIAVAGDHVLTARAGSTTLDARPVAGDGRTSAIAVRFGAVRGIAADRGGRLVVATDRGLVDAPAGDPAQAARIPIRGLRASALAAGGGAAWVGLAGRDVLLRVASGRVTRIPLRGPASALAVGAGALWVADAQAGTVFGVNPSTSVSKTGKVHVGRRPVALAAAGTAVWVVLAGDGAIARLDPRTAQPAGRPITVPGGPDAIATDGREVWVTRRDDDRVTRFDARTGRRLGEAPTPDQPIGIALAPGAAWVAGAAGDVRRIPR